MTYIKYPLRMFSSIQPGCRYVTIWAFDNAYGYKRIEGPFTKRAKKGSWITAYEMEGFAVAKGDWYKMECLLSGLL